MPPYEEDQGRGKGLRTGHFKGIGGCASTGSVTRKSRRIGNDSGVYTETFKNRQTLAI